MVTTVTSYTESRNRAYPGEGYDGVVRISVGSSYGTGALLYNGRAVLTAAHLFSYGSMVANVLFETSSGTRTVSTSHVTLLSSYDPVNAVDDLALVWLTGSAPVAADRYNLYRGSDETGQPLTIVGYGMAGTGETGILASYHGDLLRLKASNQFDADAALLKYWLGSSMPWTPDASQLVADFDDGTSAQDALGRLISRGDTGLGQDEGLIAPGDSGGPAFIDGQIAGIASYIASLSRDNIHPDIDRTINSSFGELGFWQRVSHYQQWIDQHLRAAYPNAPTNPAEVQHTVNEGDSGTSYAYFLLQFIGVRSDPSQLLSVDYATRDGSANSGEDYIAASGRLVLYPDENQAVIPVEIIGDTSEEPDETFYLDVYNPVGGSFVDGAIQLTAMRTIVNDDGSVWI